MAEKERYILFIDPDNCDGCRLCEMICALKNTGSIISPTKARIRVMKRETLGIDVPMVCRQCEDPPCRNVCPTNAITIDPKTGAVVVLEDRCIGCRECMLACPFGAISFDVEKRVCVICDLCGGDPQCVKICQWGAIRYVRYDVAEALKRRKAMEKLQEATIKAREVFRGPLV